MKRTNTPLRVGDAALALLVVSLLAAGAFGSWRLYQGLTTSCIRVRYGYDCLSDEPWNYAFCVLTTALGAMAGLGSATFIGYLRIYERP